MRGATPWCVNHFTLVCPDDCLIEAIIAFLTDNGKYGTATLVTATEFIRSWEQERGDPKDPTIFVVEGAEVADFSDNKGNRARADKSDVVAWIRRTFGEKFKMDTDAEIANKILDGTRIEKPVDEAKEKEPVVKDLEVERERLSQDRKEKQKEIRRLKFGGKRVTDKERSDQYQSIWREVYRRARVPFGIKISRLGIPEQQRVEKVLLEWCNELKNNAQQTTIPGL